MATEYQRAPVRKEVANRARLATAARTILRDAPVQAVNFGMAAALLWGEPNGDAVIAGMIEYAIRFSQAGQDMVYDAIAAQSGMAVDIKDPSVGGEGIRNGFLVALEGTDGGESTGKPFVRGHAVVIGRKGKEEFIPVGVLEDGTVVAKPQKHK